MKNRGIKNASVANSINRINKRATTEWTMAKLITLVLAVVLLVLIIYGVTNKGFGPLVDNIKGRFNEVLILLNIRDGPGDVVCDETLAEQSVGTVKGNFYPCENKCTFELLEPDELLGFSNFSVSKDGFVVMSKDGKIRDNDVAYSFGSAEADRHREAYGLLKGVVDEFLASSEAAGMSEEKFAEVMGFGEGMTFLIEVHDLWRHTFYEYGVDGWKKGVMKDGRFRGGEISAGEVKKNLWKSYGYKDEITWNYNGDGKSNALMTNFDKNLVDVEYPREEVRGWFNGLMATSREDDRRIVVEVHDEGANTFYFLKDGQWKISRLLWGDKAVSNEFVFDGIYEAHLEGWDIVWRFWKEGSKRIVSEEVYVKKNVDTWEGKFVEWFDEKQKNWTNFMNEQKALLPKVGKFLQENGDVDFRDDSYKTQLTFMEDSKVPVVYFDPSEEEKFGFYYEKGAPALFYNGGASIVSDFVGLSDEEWAKFLKINKIYEYFKLRRCGRG